MSQNRTVLKGGRSGVLIYNDLTDGVGDFHLTYSHLADLIALEKTRRVRDSVAKALWRLSGTSLLLHAGDPLHNDFSSEGFFLIPYIRVKKISREIHIFYSLPDESKEFIRENRLTTADMHKLAALKTPTAESLFFLLYDVCQWLKKDYVAYDILDMAERLGLTTYTRQDNDRYDKVQWSMLKRYILNACEEICKYCGFLRDYKVEGKGRDTVFIFYFSTCRYHLVD